MVIDHELEKLLVAFCRAPNSSVCLKMGYIYPLEKKANPDTMG
jgi:hypothetical protein